MAGNLTDFLENKLLDHSTGRAAWTAPSATYAALFTAAPSDAGGGTEVAGSGYTRIAVTWGAAASGVISNSAAVTFPAATGAWGTITHVAIFDTATGGNMLWHGPLSAEKVVNPSDQFQFAIGQLSLTLD